MRRVGLAIVVALFTLLGSLSASAGDTPADEGPVRIGSPGGPVVTPQYCRMRSSSSYVIVPSGQYSFREDVTAFTGPDDGEGFCEGNYTAEVYRVPCRGCGWQLQQSTTRYNQVAWAFGGANCGFFPGCSGYRTRHYTTWYWPPLVRTLGLW